MAQNISKNNTQERIAQIFLYVALLTPLIVGTSFSIFPFIFPKALFFEIFTGLLAAVLIPVILKNKSYSVTNVYTYTMIVYAVVLGMTGLNAFDSTRAFWSNFERMTGIVFIWSGILFSILATAYFSAHIQKLRGFLSYLVGVSVVVAFSGIIQRIDPTILMSQGSRVAGVFGNPIYLGGFCAQLALISGYLAFVQRKNTLLWWYVFATIVNLCAVYFSGTRSALVGLAGALVVIGIYTGVFFWNRGSQRVVIGSVVGVLAAIGILFALPRFVPALQGSMLARVTNIGDALSSTGSTRLIAWSIAIEGFKKRPVLGWGPENYFFVFNQYYNPKSLLHGSYETWFDHAHNAVFDVLVTQGLLGFIVYLFQYGIIMWMCVKTRSEDEDENILSVILIGIFVLHFIHNFFVFDHPGSYVEFYALGAVVAARYVVWRRGNTKMITGPTSLGQTNTIGYVVSVVAILVTAYTVIPAFRQNYLDLRAQNSANVDLNVSAQYFKDAIAVNGPYTADVLIDTGRVAQRIPLTVNGNQSFTTIPMFKNYYDFSLSSLEHVLQVEQPGNVLAAIMKGQLLMNVAQTGDASALTSANSAFDYATKLSPDRQQIAYSWSRLKMLQNDIVGAQQLLEAANAKEPEVAIGHWYLALSYIDTNIKRAADELDLAAKYGHTIDAPENRLLSGLIYGRAGQYDKALPFFVAALNDINENRWNAEYVLAGDDVILKTKQADLQAKLRAKFPDIFKIKK